MTSKRRRKSDRVLFFDPNWWILWNAPVIEAGPDGAEPRARLGNSDSASTTAAGLETASKDEAVG